MITLGTAGMLVATATIMSIGFRIGSDVYSWAKFRTIDRLSTRRIANARADERFRHLKEEESDGTGPY